MSKKIKDINEFSRLFRVRIPYEEEYDYYIDTMGRSPEYAWIPKRVEEFAQLEAD